MDYAVEIAWQINNFCNYKCTYCWLYSDHSLREESFIGIKDTQKVIAGFNRTKLKLLIHMSGGEPFFFPNFVKLCQGLTQRHAISINTNLHHKDVFNFADTIAPEKVDFIHCSLHIQQRKGKTAINDFVKKYNYLRNKKFHIFASYLMYPHLIKRFAKDYKLFKSEGVILRPKVFWGNCARFRLIDAEIFKNIRHFFGRNYPDGYSRKQKEIIASYMNNSYLDGREFLNKEQNGRKRTVELALDKNWLDKMPTFKGKHCSAGKSFVKMDQNGAVYRCNDEHQHYFGNLFNGGIKLFTETRQCSANICSCPYVGYRYAEN